MEFISIPFIALLFQGIPETVAVVTLAFVIAGIPLKWNKVLLIGTVLALCAYVVRLFPIPFGLHTILLLFILFIVLIRLSKGDASLSFMASLVSYLMLVIFEFCCIALSVHILRSTPEILFNDLIMRIVVGEPQVLLLLISAFLINKLIIKKGCINFNNSPWSVPKK